MKYIDNNGTFTIENPQLTSYLYFPVANDAGMKSALPPFLGGDAKTGQNTFLLQPVSAEELHNNKSTRNFWCKVAGKGVFSLTGASAEEESKQFLDEQNVKTTLEAGLSGRGWRDLWQDCLALLMMNPDGVGRMLVDNFAGVRVDGSNATIIGTKQGEFIADRNSITRVWMDHGLWPLMTTDFYIQQTGDVKLLLEEVPYFKDAQIMRGTAHDADWSDEQGCWQQDASGNVVRGSIVEHIRKTEWIAMEDKGWFNSYYDNHGRAVEGSFESGIRMMLTGQVFAIMSGTATEEQTAKMVKAADAYLYEERIGGYRLNTNFHEQKDDLGRMFGFAYGHKENGAVFSHMTTMYANALYQRGFAVEGYKALYTLFSQAADFETSRIYPGIPEYFSEKGRGMYHYLTGAASWYMMTVITQMYGVRGERGNLKLAPKLMESQFDANGDAYVELSFAGKHLKLCYKNQKKLQVSDYKIGSVSLNGNILSNEPIQEYTIARELLEDLSDDECHVIEVGLV